MDLVQRLKAAIGWLGGALAALTAICYATGYYTFHAHLTMLGLGQVVEFRHEQMLLEGARFFFAVTAHLLKLSTAIGAGLVVLLVLAALLREIGPVNRGWRAVREWTGARRLRLDAARPALAGTALLAALVTLLVVHSDRFFYPLLDIGGIEGLLFRADVPATAGCRALIPTTAAGLDPESASALLMQGGRCNAYLLAEFRRLLDGYLVLLIALMLVFSMQPTLRPVRLLRAFRFALAAYAMVYTLLLPIGFGLLVRSAVYPVAKLTFKDGAAIQGSLVARNDKSVLLWQPEAHKAVWYASETIATIDVIGQQDLFARPEGVVK